MTMESKKMKLFRDKLLKRKDEILVAYNRNKGYGKEADIEGAQDIADKAASSYTKEFLFSLSNSEREMLQDVDEARIPLWTLRGTVKLVDNWKWLSSFFLDAYMVPGIIDTTVPINPIPAGVSPFGPDVRDPQEQTGGQAIPQEGKPPVLVHLAQVDRLPDVVDRDAARLAGLEDAWGRFRADAEHLHRVAQTARNE